MPERDRICLECGHTYAWHTRERSQRMLGADPGEERTCYRRIGMQPCPCPEWRASNERATPAPAVLGSVGRSALLTVLLVVMGLALLYAYRSQTPALPTVPLSQAIQDVQAGKVKVVTIAGTNATLELVDATRERTIVPSGGQDALSQAVLAYNQANPTRQVQLRYESTDTGFSPIGSILLSLLPVLLIGGFFYWMMTTMRRRDG